MERVERIQKQIQSLEQQTIDTAEYEAIFVVNNDEEEGEEVRTLNQLVIEYIRSCSNLPIFVIDKSSPGCEITDCNVGRARNRGVAEASLRFYENGRNGIIIQTDADTYFDDPEYLEKLKEVFKQAPDTVGIAGGLVFELDPDTQDFSERYVLEQKVERFIQLKIWDTFQKFLHGEPGFLQKDRTFSGAHMISRSFETAVIGGLADVTSGEDPQFGNDLSHYAEYNHGRVIGKKDELKVVTALRDSDRTPSSFKKLFDSIDLSGPLQVDGQEITPELLERTEKEVLEKEGGRELVENMRTVIHGLRLG